LKERWEGGPLLYNLNWGRGGCYKTKCVLKMGQKKTGSSANLGSLSGQGEYDWRAKTPVNKNLFHLAGKRKGKKKTGRASSG